jgi:hypothetical protein
VKAALMSFHSPLTQILRVRISKRARTDSFLIVSNLFFSFTAVVPIDAS